ncbi:hypothetical protein GCM10007171_40720 [Dickeya fangzhongdai]|nr:hypothetical protein GCM10007171_40720 [Dickeya fangzhongdai]
MQHLAELVAKARTAIEQAGDVAALENVRVEFLGKKGHLTLQMTSLRELPAEERPAAGAVINQAKQEVQDALNARKQALEGAESLTSRCRVARLKTVACIRSPVLSIASKPSLANWGLRWRPVRKLKTITTTSTR